MRASFVGGLAQDLNAHSMSAVAEGVHDSGLCISLRLGCALLLELPSQQVTQVGALTSLPTGRGIRVA